ncbi:MAG TPA: bifunctional metallophosphatase/5'-nucleotidase [Deltaproteobacteria bacterium]|nr:bifunctional metallophosphatase/5'-nucleotidase [Deltaproteobacteria bacterium]
MKRNCSMLLTVIIFMLLQACSPARDRFTLTIAHINDTHSHLETTPATLQLNGTRTVAGLGGMARLKTAVDELRSRKPETLLLHAGDAVQGTLYFNLFNGKPEFELLNMLGVDAMTFGNHEFDRGPAMIPSFLTTARFPILSANIDFSGEPVIAPHVRPFMIRDVAGEKVGIIGVTTESTPISTSSVGRTRFNDSKAAVEKAVAILQQQGVNKIIVLSHLGYAEDIKLAAQVAGVDAVVGGHSHTLLGDGETLGRLGLKADGAYPAVVSQAGGGKALVVQAWKWGYVLGELEVTFNASGEVDSFSGRPHLVAGDVFSRNGIELVRGSADYQSAVKALQADGAARIYPQDVRVAAYLKPYTARLACYRRQVLARTEKDLMPDTPDGLGALVAESMLAGVPAARLALMNSGGIRKPLLAGDISVGDVLEMLPFANTLYIIDLDGAEIKASLEEGLEFLVRKFEGCSQLPLPHLAGARYTVNLTRPAGRRVLQVEIRDARGGWQPLQPTEVYRLVVNSFIAGGGDGFATIKRAARHREDSGIIDADAFAAYIKARGTL